MERKRLTARDRANDYNSAVAALDHAGKNSAREHYRRHAVQHHHRTKPVRFELVEASRVTEPGIVDEDSDRQIGDRIGKTIRALSRGKIDGDGPGLNPVPFRKLAAERLQPVLSPGGEYARQALARKGLRKRKTDSGRSTGHQRPFAVPMPKTRIVRAHAESSLLKRCICLMATALGGEAIPPSRLSGADTTMNSQRPSRAQSAASES